MKLSYEYNTSMREIVQDQSISCEAKLSKQHLHNPVAFKAKKEKETIHVTRHEENEVSFRGRIK